MSEENAPQKERFLREVEQQLLRKELDAKLLEDVLIHIRWKEKPLDLLLYAVKLLFFCIRERRVILQRKLTGIPDHGKLLIRKKALAFHKTGADGEVLLRGFIVFHEIMPNVNALPVEVPLPRHEFSALFPKLSSQHRITKICKHLEGIL